MQRQVRPEHELQDGQIQRSEPSFNHDGSSQQYSKEQQMRNDVSEQLSQTFGPTLTVMKLAGELFGETTWIEPRDLNWEDSVYISRFYSSLVVLGEWLLVVMGLITLCCQGFTSMNVFLYLFVTTIWYIQCASSTTICSVVLPLAKRRRSRFSQFISSVITTMTDFEGVRRKTLLGLTIACFVAVMNSVVLVLFSLYHGGIISIFKPWNGHMAVRVIEIAVGTCNSFAWSLPVQLYCTTCLVLERMFETLKKKVTSSLDAERPFTISCLRQEHLRLCKILEMADRIFSPFLFVTVTLNIPLICVNLYQLIKSTKNWSSETEWLSFFGYLYWSVCLATILGVVCLFGSRVNEKAHSFCEELQMCHVSVRDINDNSELMLFLAHVQREPIGFSSGGLAVINKSFFLTLVGIIASYFAVLLTLPS